MSRCSVTGCTSDNDRCRRGMCSLHYRRWLKHGDPSVVMRPRGPLVERFWARVDRSGGLDACWLWTGKRDRRGYGILSDYGKYLKAHRVAARWAYGDPPADQPVVRHLCHTTSCVNPLHLRYGTQKENIADAVNSGRHYTPFTLEERAKHGLPLRGRSGRLEREVAS